MRKILFPRDSICLQPLTELVNKQQHKTLVLWALDSAEHYLEYFEKNRPDDCRPKAAMDKARLWARGDIKMPEAKKAIHAAHAAAAEIGDKDRHSASVLAAGRAIAHAAATVHVQTHAMGVVFYGLTSTYYAAAESEASAACENQLGFFYDRLLHFEQSIEADKGQWAEFLLKRSQ